MTATPQGDTVECRDLSGRGSSCKLQLNGAETLLSPPCVVCAQQALVAGETSSRNSRAINTPRYRCFNVYVL
ncbi:hypothetical protein PC129_g13571 [Phytophthora cactorum]|uniref:Uncharacterized protein n=1 Tax=Phytophthora cactorum TaxID=29920 RepID=A0A8T1BPB4_9STRA|nr:hypothetical protein PC114_g15962 [Phytophthora cactorum]KAG2907240.1 hypothetical protein PC115_g14026 [Phytophthora cactorum]KAG3011528.1 hypothetical protein PC120_g14379 [Phytophthora cactorum]KAG3055610.1 hypothetical protein PC121_g15676 [Phytophthora cactorum]KAG3074210.1 hypothetical protein PC122_g14490 [Phytophthora cactorum]